MIIIIHMSTIVTFNRNFTVITKELAYHIHTACDLAVMKKLTEMSLCDLERASLTYNFTFAQITAAKAYLKESGFNIYMMKSTYNAIAHTITRIYYVLHNRSYFTVISINNQIVECI